MGAEWCGTKSRPVWKRWPIVRDRENVRPWTDCCFSYGIPKEQVKQVPCRRLTWFTSNHIPNYRCCTPLQTSGATILILVTTRADQCADAHSGQHSQASWQLVNTIVLPSPSLGPIQRHPHRSHASHDRILCHYLCFLLEVHLHPQPSF